MAESAQSSECQDLNLKGIDRVLVGRCKALAYGEGMTLKDWVVERLEEATDGKVRTSGRDLQAASVQERSVPEVRPATTRGESRTGTTAVAEEPHDPESCRVHACPRCRMIGVADRERGL